MINKEQENDSLKNQDKEQIIIDGVDVSRCVSFDKLNGQNICCYEDTREDKLPFANFCVENKDCYYKQLARKTQECEKYEQAFDSIVATIKDLENENIVTFPDFSLKENCKIIMGQCNEGYRQIINIINKAKGQK